MTSNKTADVTMRVSLYLHNQLLIHPTDVNPIDARDISLLRILLAQYYHTGCIAFAITFGFEIVSGDRIY